MEPWRRRSAGRRYWRAAAGGNLAISVSIQASTARVSSAALLPRVSIVGPEGEVRQEFVSLLDCTATILDLAGLDSAPAVDSRSLLPLVRELIRSLEE